MTNEELFDAYRQVVSERDQLRIAGDRLWGAVKTWGFYKAGKYADDVCSPWEALRSIGAEPPIEEFRCG